MKTKPIRTLLFLSGVFLFDLLFWMQKPGVNLFLFSALLMIFSWRVDRSALRRNEVLIAIAPWLISGIMVIWHNTGISVSVHFLSTIILLGLIKQNRLNSIFEGFIGFFSSYWDLVQTSVVKLRTWKKQNKGAAFLYSFIKLGGLPFILFGLFFILYRNASPKFEELTEAFSTFMIGLFENINIARVLFVLSGIVLLAFALRKIKNPLSSLLTEANRLVRARKNYSGKIPPIKENLYMELKNEYKIAVLVFGLLNLLLLIVNVLDISWIWIGFEVPLEFNLKQFVHEGTYLLILSIILSIVIVLYFFRDSLNFYPSNKLLVILGKVWIIQNGVLTLSVFVRNYHYINYHGLAGKRIGIIVFLSMTLFGLVTLIIKVNKLKTLGYLLRKNGWFILITLSLTTCFNWDRIIVYNNLNHPNRGEIDVDYYLKLSPHVASIILRNIDVVEQQIEAHLEREGKEVWLNYREINSFKKQLEWETAQYISNQKEYTWPSWNYPDWKLFKKIKVIEEN